MDIQGGEGHLTNWMRGKVVKSVRWHDKTSSFVIIFDDDTALFVTEDDWGGEVRIHYSSVICECGSDTFNIEIDQRQAFLACWIVCDWCGKKEYYGE